jgi:RNA polymerase sigma-70 factor (ECF subfamily)
MNLPSKTKAKKLFRDIKKCDQEAFLKAYDLYSNQLFRFIYFKINNREEAQDLTSAVFLKAWNYLQTSEDVEEKTLGALFYKIARNAIIDYYRANFKTSNYSIDDPELKIDLPDRKSDPANQTETILISEKVQKKLQLLKDEYREIILLKYTEELSTSEIAKITGKTRGNVRITSYRALKALKELMEEEN